MNERLREIRAQSGLSTRAFAEKIGMSPSAISLLEANKRTFTNRTISDICRTFNVNETWLRTGEGEMYAPLTREAEIGQIVAEMYHGNNDLKLKLIKLLSKATDEQMKLLEDLAKAIYEDTLDI